MPAKASIAIMHGHLKEDTKNKDTTPVVPDEVFEAAQRVSNSKTTEVLKTAVGTYIVEYSETGPFKEKQGDDWLPVHISKLITWHSGGIRKSEQISYNESKIKG